MAVDTLEIVALDKVAYRDFMESMKLVLGAELALCSDPGPALVEVSLNDMALRSLPARSLSKSALMIFPVDLFKSLEAFKSLLASA